MSELDAIRARRLAEMQAQAGGMEGLKKQGQAAEEQQKQQAQRQDMLNQIMDQAARARFANLQCVKPEKAEMITSMLMQMAKQGRLPGQINETMLKDMLAQVSEQTEAKQSVKFQRRKMDSDDEDDE